MSLKFFKLRQQSPVVDQGKSEKVQVKKLKNGSMMIVHGTNAFAVPSPDAFSRISVEQHTDLSWSLLGKTAAGTETVCASFPTKMVAADAHKGFMKAYAGMDFQSRGWKLKALLAAGCIWLVMSFFSSWYNSSNTQRSSYRVGQDHIGASEIGTLPQTQTQTLAQTGTPSATTEQMANGGYKFQPQIRAPEITAPELNCAAKS